MKMQSSLILLLVAFSVFRGNTGHPSSSWNSLVNIRNLINEQYEVLEGGKGVSSDYLLMYRTCYKSRELGADGEIRAAFIFAVEGEDLIFDCGPCAPLNHEVYWRWVTFEGVDTELERVADEDSVFKPIAYEIIEGGRKLRLISPKPDLSSFYCYWKDVEERRVVSRVWTVEIASVAHMEKISARQWQRNVSAERAPYQDLSGTYGRIRVSTEWGDFSPCSRCGGLSGKRYKTGFCSVNKISPESVEALQLFQLPVSCSLLVDFHPEILSDSTALESFSRMKNLNHVLGRPHVIMMAYCRRRRDCLQNGFKSSNKVIAELLQDFEMLGDGASSSRDTGDNGKWWSARRFIWLLQSLVHGMPIIGWGNMPEIFLLVALFSLQIYVVYLVCKWRRAAK